VKRIFAFAAAAALITGSGAADAGADRKSRLLTVENASSLALHYFYASTIGSSAWQEDLLGEEVIAAGQSLAIDLDTGTNACVYDLKAVMADGRDVSRYNVNICTVSKWTITDTGDSIS
jgi:hypothetical protein